MKIVRPKPRITAAIRPGEHRLIALNQTIIQMIRLRDLLKKRLESDPENEGLADLLCLNDEVLNVLNVKARLIERSLFLT